MQETTPLAPNTTMAPHEIMELHELLNTKTINIAKAKAIDGMVTDRDLKPLLQRYIQQSLRALDTLQNFALHARLEPVVNAIGRAHADTIAHAGEDIQLTDLDRIGHAADFNHVDEDSNTTPSQ